MNKTAFKSALIFSHATVLTLLTMITMAKPPSSLSHFTQGTETNHHATIFASYLF